MGNQQKDGLWNTPGVAAVLSSLTQEKQLLCGGFTGFLALVVKNLPADAGDSGDAGDVGSTSGLGRSPGRGHGSSLQHSCMENPMDRGAWWAAVHRITKSWPRLKRLSTHTQLCTHFLELFGSFFKIQTQAYHMIQQFYL